MKIGNNEDKKNKTSTKYNIYLFLNLRQMGVISGMASMRRTPPGFEFVVIAIIIITKDPLRKSIPLGMGGIGDGR